MPLGEFRPSSSTTGGSSPRPARPQPGSAAASGQQQSGWQRVVGSRGIPPSAPGLDQSRQAGASSQPSGELRMNAVPDSAPDRHRLHARRATVATRRPPSTGAGRTRSRTFRARAPARVPACRGPPKSTPSNRRSWGRVGVDRDVVAHRLTVLEHEHERPRSPGRLARRGRTRCPRRPSLGLSGSSDAGGRSWPSAPLAQPGDRARGPRSGGRGRAGMCVEVRVRSAMRAPQAPRTAERAAEPAERVAVVRPTSSASRAMSATSIAFARYATS